MRYLSVYSTDENALIAMADIHLRGKWYDCDCTYSKGVFYKNIPSPKYKSDILPQAADVIEADCRELAFLSDNSINSIVFDPPFLFRNRKAKNNDKMCKRFSYFNSYEELLLMYEESLICFHKKLKRNGKVFFKCQDMTDRIFYCTHFDIIRLARINGFELQDILIKTSKSKLQRDAKQQNCVAKTHCYWLVFKKAR